MDERAEIPATRDRADRFRRATASSSSPCRTTALRAAAPGFRIWSSRFEAIAASWAALGVHADPEIVSPPKLYGPGGSAYTGDFQAALFASCDGIDPDPFKHSLQSRYIDRQQSSHSEANANFAAVNDPVIDTAFERGAVTFDLAVRRRYYSQIEREVNRKAHWIPIFFLGTVTLDDGRIATFTPVFWDVYAWKLK